MLFEELIDHGVELHHAAVLPEIVLGFAQEQILLSVAAHHRDLLWTLQRSHDFDLHKRNVCALSTTI